MPADTLLWPTPPAGWGGAPLGLPSPSAPAVIHVWAIPLDLPPDTLCALGQILSPAERDRAARFHFQRHRDRFIAGRGSLRLVLAGYLQTDASSLDFLYGPQGKPALAPPFAAGGLCFNLAHSEDLALLAVTRGCHLGVDVEHPRPLNDAADLVQRFFSRRENDLFRALPPEQQPAAFFNLWTRKEAWLKATGEGIAHSLHRVEVSFLPGEPARLLSLPEPFSRGPAWTLVDLAPQRGFTAALAVQTNQVQVHCWRWPGALE